MVTVDTIGRIRRAFWVDKKPIRRSFASCGSRGRRCARRSAGRRPSRYERQVQPQPRLGVYVTRLDGLLEANKVAHIRLCHSRMFLVGVYPRESQEMVFDAHDRAFRLFGGACRRGIYDNMTTAVEAVCRAQRLAGSALPRPGARERTPRAERQDGVGSVRADSDIPMDTLPGEPGRGSIIPVSAAHLYSASMSLMRLNRR
jgi:hypothetical protein